MVWYINTENSKKKENKAEEKRNVQPIILETFWDWKYYIFSDWTCPLNFQYPSAQNTENVEL